MEKLNKNEKIIFIIGSIGVFISLISGYFDYGLIILTLIAAYFSMVIFSYIAIVIVALNSGLNIYGLLYTAILFSIFYEHWMKGNKLSDRLSFTFLSEAGLITYANYFAIILILNIFLGMLQYGIIQGISLNILLPTILSVLIFFTLWLSAQRYYEGIYFYMAYNILLIVNLIINNGDIKSIILVILILILSGFFIKEHK